MKKRTFFSLSYIIIILFSFALFAGCSVGEQAVEIDKAAELVKEYKEKKPYTTSVYRDLVKIGNPAVKASIDGYMESLQEKAGTTTELESWYSDVYFRQNLILTLGKIKTPGAVEALGRIADAEQEYIALPMSFPGIGLLIRKVKPIS